MWRTARTSPFLSAMPETPGVPEHPSMPPPGARPRSDPTRTGRSAPPGPPDTVGLQTDVEMRLGPSTTAARPSATPVWSGARSSRGQQSLTEPTGPDSKLESTDPAAGQADDGSGREREPATTSTVLLPPSPASTAPRRIPVATDGHRRKRRMPSRRPGAPKEAVPRRQPGLAAPTLCFSPARNPRLTILPIARMVRTLRLDAKSPLDSPPCSVDASSSAVCPESGSARAPVPSEAQGPGPMPGPRGLHDPSQTPGSLSGTGVGRTRSDPCRHDADCGPRPLSLPVA